jgi:hypothetical protein
VIYRAFIEEISRLRAQIDSVPRIGDPNLCTVATLLEGQPIGFRLQELRNFVDTGGGRLRFEVDGGHVVRMGLAGIESDLRRINGIPQAVCEPHRYFEWICVYLVPIANYQETLGNGVRCTKIDGRRMNETRSSPRTGFN